MIITRKHYKELLDEISILKKTIAQAEADRFQCQERYRNAKQLIGQQKSEINILKQKLFAKNFAHKNKKQKKELQNDLHARLF